MKSLKRYDGHRSHIGGIARAKRLIQLTDIADDFENWRHNQLEINWHGMRCQQRSRKQRSQP